MSLAATLILLLSAVVSPIWAATHDELAQCGLMGVYKTRQSVLESPNYPNNYPISTCWDYVVRSPYRCPTKFHIQFLDFFLESSVNCTNDYLAIGLENDGDDMDVLCGQVIGIKKYHTPDGVLRLRFLSDDSPWTTGKGFKLLITRLACERDDLLKDNLEASAEQTAPQAPILQLQPPLQSVATLFRNFSAQEQHQIYPLPAIFGSQGPVQLPVPPQPAAGSFYQTTQPALQVPPQALAPPNREQPCVPATSQLPQLPQYYLPTQSYQSYQQLPLLTDQYPSSSWQSTVEQRSRDAQTVQQLPSGLTQQACCAASFQQQRFYLSSPGFPKTAFTSLLPTQQRDCQFQLRKFAPSVCRLHVAFRYFDFGQPYTGTGAPKGNINVAIASSKDVCTEDYLEIDGERFCGCRSGYVHISYWGNTPKGIRMRLGYSGLPSTGFLLDILQEQCFPIEQHLNGHANFAPQQEDNRPYNGFVPTGFGVAAHSGFTNFGLPQNAYAPKQPPFIQSPPQAQFPAQLQPQSQTQSQPQLPPQPLPPLLPQQQSQSQQPTPLNVLSSHQQQYPIYQQPTLYQQPQFNDFQSQFHFRYNPHVPQPQFWTTAPQFRAARSLDYAKSENAQQPLTVVETNSTRKEFYFYDGDEAFARAKLQDEPDDPQRVFSVDKPHCSFDTADALRLSSDVLWITKPICHAPQRSLFTRSVA